MLGFSCFAIGIYAHSQNRIQHRKSNVDLDYDRAGTVR